jgi:WD40 repeat protein
VISKQAFEYALTSVNASQDGSVLFVGSEKGIMRIFDVSNRSLPRMVKIYNFFETPITNIEVSDDGKFLAVSSNEQDELVILSGDASTEFEFIGWTKVKGKILSTSLIVDNLVSKVLCVLDNSLFVSINVPTDFRGRKQDDIGDETAKPLYRKVDKGMTQIIVNHSNNDIFLSGDDKLLKKYQLPEE